jgi:hypothetical protein
MQASPSITRLTHAATLSLTSYRTCRLSTQHMVYYLGNIYTPFIYIYTLLDEGLARAFTRALYWELGSALGVESDERTSSIHCLKQREALQF